MQSARGSISHLSREVSHQLLHSDGITRTGNISFVQQLRGHDIRYFGRRGSDSLLANDGLLEFIDMAVKVAKREWERVHGVTWVGEHNHLHDTWVTWTAVPDWVRKTLAIPQCMNTVSFLVFMVLDLLFYVGVLRAIRFLIRDTQIRWIGRNRQDIESMVAFPGTVALMTLAFAVIRVCIPWAQKPGLIITFFLTLYVYVQQNHVQRRSILDVV